MTRHLLPAVIAWAGAAGCSADSSPSGSDASGPATGLDGDGAGLDVAGRSDERSMPADVFGPDRSDSAAADAGARDVGASSVDAPAGRPVLIFTRSTGFVHDSTAVAAQTIASAARAAGFAPELSDDPARFAPAALARYSAVVLVATAGEPLGASAGVDALAAFVREGGGLVGIENATNAHVGSAAYVALFGAVFDGHPGGIRRASCFKEGDHPSVAALPSPWEVTDEIYVFTRFRMDNQVVLRCGTERVPIAWHRTEGRGRVFYTALGHGDEVWTRSRIVPDHVLPGLAWAARR